MHPQNHHGVPVRGDNSANYWPPRNNSDSYHYCVPKTINYRTPQSNNDLAPPYQPNNFNSSGRHSYQTHTPTNQYGSTNFNYRASSSNNDSAPSYQHNRFNSSGRHSYQTNTPANNYVSAHSSSSKNISNHHQAPLFRNEQFSAPFTTKQPNDHVFSAPPPLNDSRPYTPFSNSTTSNSSGTQSPIPQENFHSNFKSNRDDIAAAFINANIEKINQRKTGTSNSSGTQSPIPQENFHLNSKSNSDDIAAAFINANLKRINQRTTGTTNSSSGIASRASINQNKSHKDEYQNCESKKSLDDEMLDFVSNNFLHLKKLPQLDSSEFIKRSPERRNHRRSRSRSRSNTRYSRTISKSPSPTHGTISRFNVHESFSNRNHKDDSKKTSRSRSRSGSRSRNKINRRRSQSPSLHLNVHPSQKYSKNDSRRSISKSRSRSPDCSKSAQNRRRKSRERQRQGTATVTEREELLLKYNKDYCPTITAFEEKIKNMNNDFEDDPEQMCWLRDTPSELYYRVPDPLQPNEKQSSKRLDKLCDDFEEALIKRADRIRSTLPKYEMPARKKKVNLAKHKCNHSAHSSDESSSSNSDGGNNSDEEDCTMQELLRKKSHPLRLHPELWFNDKGEMNDGPLCRCSAKASRSGIRHNIYAGENNLPKCTTNTNNFSKLYHYRMTISPPTNFLIKTPTIIPYDNHEYIFEGFSMFSHKKLDKLPACKVIRFNIEYTILYFDEETPKNFTIRELDIFHEYLFKELLELVDLDFKGAGGDPDRCSQFHFMPRFVRELPDNGKEILSMNEALIYFLENSSDLVKESDLARIPLMKQSDWEKEVDKVKGMIVTKPAMKPCALRIDQLDRDPVEGKTSPYPEIVHFGIRPPQLSYAGNPEYQKAWREYVKFRHLLANMPKPSYADKRKLEVKENQLQQMRTWTKMKRDVTITVNSEGFKKTGIMCDIVQHAMLIPVLVSHLRFHSSLDVLEDTIHYKFENRFLLQLALTHPSYRENFGTNPDHARNSLTNCGIRQPEYGDRRIHYMNTRKRGINTLINIMSRFGKRKVTESNITHNERLEFLGDAVVEFITSIHLFHMFPQLEEGGLATYRAAVVQNQHLAELAKTLKLDEYMLYAHGSDLCHELELRHAMANCFEALMGALFLDGGIEVADKVFGETFFSDEKLLDVWVNYPPHPLQEQEPVNDRHWISKFEILQKLTKFEELIGVNFTHIRLLARAFTDRSMGFTHLTLGSNQRLEFLGDTVLQLIASEYLYKYYPEHHEGHLSLLRSSLVNNRTQAVVCNDLGMTAYALYSNPKAELKTKDRADLLEAFLGALYIDKGMDYCKVFCNVCFFPRLQTSIMKQDWNDPKSKLQQCCLTLRTMEGGEPEIPVYKVIECMGPTNGREFTVAVYFKGRRLAKATGNSIQQAEMNSAKMALQQSHNLFPQLDHQKRVIAKSLSQRPPRRRNQTNKNSSLQNKIALTTTKRSANDH